MNLKKKKKKFVRYASDSVNRMLIGNKCDMNERRAVSYEEGLELGNI